MSPYRSPSYLLRRHRTREASTLGRNQTMNMVVIGIATIFKSHSTTKILLLFLNAHQRSALCRFTFELGINPVGRTQASG